MKRAKRNVACVWFVCKGARFLLIDLLVEECVGYYFPTYDYLMLPASTQHHWLMWEVNVTHDYSLRKLS